MSNGQLLVVAEKDHTNALYYSQRSYVHSYDHTQNINIQEIFADWWVLLNSEIVYEYIGKLVFTLDEKVANGLLAKAKKASTTAPCSVPEKEYLRFIGGDWIEIFSVVPETNYIFLLLLLEVCDDRSSSRTIYFDSTQSRVPCELMCSLRRRARGSKFSPFSDNEMQKKYS
ncbi:hypothetical protein RIR_jg2948.t1 [Rhizophagus irregularis DAOM 181602=DAOM 197198]|uniref:Uncharacterized protein n=1 Tax=Rhizophagus irregularis (strain DAOM 181602 / DAOM 197198 / MUCL 43194) TaxID=747089 RepID=U9USG7_RHIID|nr:hypothetical protein RIR_jg2948.t1 [Rhizophagus irregularis DAOM 181602=DAOM 197198]